MNGANEAEAVSRMAMNMGEMVTRVALEGSVYMVKLAGRGSMNVLAFLAAAAKSEKSAGKERLATLLKSGAPLKVYTFKEEHMKEFMDAAKRYGIVYSVVKRDEADRADGVFDVMVKADDAARINRIFEKLNYAEVDASLTASEADEKEKRSEAIADVRELLEKMMQPSHEMENPGLAVEGDSLYTASLQPADRRPSVKKQIADIKHNISDREEENKKLLAQMMQSGGELLDEEDIRFIIPELSDERR